MFSSAVYPASRLPLISVYFSLEEDAVIALLPEIRAGLARNVAEVLDDIILNAEREGMQYVPSGPQTCTLC